MQSAGTSSLGGKPSIFGQNTLGQLSASQSSAVVQPAPVTNPFGTLPVMPQMSIGRTRMSPSIPYGISSLPHSVFTDNLGRCSFCNVHVVTDIIFQTGLIYRRLILMIINALVGAFVCRANPDKTSPPKDTSTPPHGNGKRSEAASTPNLYGSSAEDKDKTDFWLSCPASEWIEMCKG
ncbi:unnamed protein product [Ilex paraguariensis]|uniref:Uncharacterized protein n=1 Tax=Ilex paraguariensis TaxID=185542 RepID=A0ABC8T825_9AQUA